MDDSASGGRVASLDWLKSARSGRTLIQRSVWLVFRRIGLHKGANSDASNGGTRCGLIPMSFAMAIK